MNSAKNQRALALGAAIERIVQKRDAEGSVEAKARAKAERAQTLCRFLKIFMGEEANPMSDVYYEGMATRKLLKTVGCHVIVFYRQDDSAGSYAYVLEKNGEILRVPLHRDGGWKRDAQETHCVDSLLLCLGTQDVTWEQILANIRGEVDRILKLFGENPLGADANAGSALPPGSCIVKVGNEKFRFNVLYGYGLVTVGGWLQLISFNCPATSAARECEALCFQLSDDHLAHVAKNHLYHNQPVHLPVS